MAPETTDYSAASDALLGPVAPSAPIQTPDVQTATQTTNYDITPFEEVALGVLQDAKDYDSGLASLHELYRALPDEEKAQAAQPLAKYGDAMSYKFREPYMDMKETIKLAPIKIEEFPEDEDGKIEAISKWQQDNLAALNNADTPIYLGIRDRLKRSINQHASIARRELLGQRGEGVVPWVADKFFRAASGMISPFAYLAGDEEIPAALTERTDPARDEDISSMVAHATGTIAPVVAAGVAGPAGPLAVMGAQTAGNVRETYRSALERSGDPDTAMKAAGIDATVGVAMMIPGMGIAGKPAKSVAEQLLLGGAKVNAAKVIAKNAGEMAAYNMIGGIGANINEGIITGEDPELTRGLGKQALAGLIVGGGMGSIHAVAQQRAMKQMERARSESGLVDAINQVKEHDHPRKETLDKTVSWEEELGPDDPPPRHMWPGQAESNARTEDSAWLEEPTLKVNKKDETKRAPRPGEKPKAEKSEESFEEMINRYHAEQFPEKADRNLSAAEKLRDLSREQYKGVHEAYEKDVELGALGPEKDAENLRAFEELIQESEMDPLESSYEGVSDPAFRNPYPGRDVPSAPGHLYTLLGAYELQKAKLAGQSVGTYGSFMARDAKKNPGQLMLLRGLGADPHKLVGTALHELFHSTNDLRLKNLGFLDVRERVAKRNSETVMEKAGLLAPAWADAFEAVNKEGADLSAAWRGEWQRGQNKYRDSAEEQMADSFAALLKNPDWVQENFPNLFRAFEEGLGKHPLVAEAWDAVKEYAVNPDKALELHAQLRAGSLKKQAEIQKKFLMEKKLKNALWYKTHQALQDTYRHLFEAGYDVRRAAERVAENDPDLKERIYEALNDVETVRATGVRNNNLDWWTKNLELKRAEAGITPGELDEYLSHKFLLDQTTDTIQSVREEPGYYMAAMERLLDSGSELPHIGRATDLDPKGEIRAAINAEDTEAFLNAMAKTVNLHLTMLSPNDFAPIYERMKAENDRLKNPLSEAELKRRAWKKKERLDAKVENEKTPRARDNIRAWIANEENMGVDAAPLSQLFDPKSYNIRRYLIQDYFNNPKASAERQQAMINRWGEGGAAKYKKLEEMAAEWHKNTTATIVDWLDKAGILSPEMKRSFELNKNTYVTSTILDYFSGDEKVSSAIRAAKGSFKEHGSYLAGTLAKLKALNARAHYQRASNAIVDIASLDGVGVEEVPVRHWAGENAFSKRLEMAARDKENTYLTQMTEGKATLYKIEGKHWADIFKSVKSEDIPGLNIMAGISRLFNSMFLTKALKTVLNPVFTFKQPLIDISDELMRYHSIMPNFLLWKHIQPELSKWRSDGKKVLDHYIETRKFLPTEMGEHLKELVDLEGVMSPGEFGLNVHGTTDTVRKLYEGMGVEDMSEAMTLQQRIAARGEEYAKKVPGLGFTSRKAERDEMLTKLMVYKISLSQNKTRAQAARDARLYGGTPDPMGGGRSREAIGDLFLFGPAWLGGIRKLVDFVAKSDNKKASMAQLVYRGVMPKLLTNPIIGKAVVGGLIGAAAGEVYGKLAEKLPSFSRIAGNPIIAGATDENGDFHWLWEIKDASEINDRWKTAYVPGFQSREAQAVAAVMLPLFDSAMEGEYQQGVGKAMKGAGSTLLAGNVQPTWQIVAHLLELGFFTENGNAWDTFRNKWILPKDIEEGAGPARKGWEMMKYWGSQQVPGIIPSSVFNYQSDKQGADRLINDIPVMSPMGSLLLRTSSYGDAERLTDKGKAIAKVKANIRRDLGELSADLRKQYQDSQHRISSYGEANEKWKVEMNPKDVRRAKLLSRWESRVYQPYFKKILEATQAQEPAAVIEGWMKRLEDASLPYVEYLDNLDKPQERGQPSSKSQ